MPFSRVFLGSKASSTSIDGKNRRQSGSEQQKRKERGSPKKKLRLLPSLDSYYFMEVVGKGTFGVVYKAQYKKNDSSIVAIKKVRLESKRPNRELEILSRLNHKNCVRLRSHFMEQVGEPVPSTFLNLVMDFHPYSLDRVIEWLPTNLFQRRHFIQLYAFQLLEALCYLDKLSIVHRDIKPQNILLNSTSETIVLCDFGSARFLKGNETGLSTYVCSRFYRAPELIMGEGSYSKAVDMWSVGCVIAELFLGYPLFRGENSKSQFIEIMKVLGSPTNGDLKEMSPNIQVSIPKVSGLGLQSLIPHYFSDLLDLLSQILKLNPRKRLTPAQAKSHSFFANLSKQSSP